MNKRVTAAFAFGSALLLAAYTASDFGAPAAPQANPTQAVVAARAPERVYIPSEDSNTDGIPDWQEDLIAPQTITLPASSTPYTPPDTLTGQFSVYFFEQYMQDRIYSDLSGTTVDTAAEGAALLAAQAVDKLYTYEDIVPSSDNSRQAIEAYGAELSKVFTTTPGPSTTRNELTILNEAIETNNPEVLTELASITASYMALRDALLLVRVPSSFSKEHLDLVNTINAIYIDIGAMEKAFTDPFLSMIRMKRYQDDALGMASAITNLNEKLRRAGVTY